MSEMHESGYAILQLGDYANRETCQIHHAAQINFSLNLHYSFQEQIEEMKNENNIP